MYIEAGSIFPPTSGINSIIRCTLLQMGRCHLYARVPEQITFCNRVCPSTHVLIAFAIVSFSVAKILLLRDLRAGVNVLVRLLSDSAGQLRRSLSTGSRRV